jgi:hypothetical protein
MNSNQWYKKLNSDNFKNALSKNRMYDDVVWHFIPPRAPTFGGLWESTVKLVKYNLIRVIGGQLLTYEELTTVLYKIESILIPVQYKLSLRIPMIYGSSL